ncbi:MAG: hypothetical protein ABEJ36_06430 [Candidatus Nanosalina sp.]
MAFSSVVYETFEGEMRSFNTGDRLPFNDDLRVEEIRVGDDGEWIIVHYTNMERDTDGSVMMPKERVIRMGEEREIL